MLFKAAPIVLESGFFVTWLNGPRSQGTGQMLAEPQALANCLWMPPLTDKCPMVGKGGDNIERER